MDELLIGEKKYVSSKRAAKLTGYAKDYVGQLCREGRVPARLVGRSWYVLESAIQDHRFGPTEVEEKAPAKKEAPVSTVETWEAPRYEAAPAAEILPSINRLETFSARHESVPAPAEATGPTCVPEETIDLHQSWTNWFDTAHEATAGTESGAEAASLVEEPVVAPAEPSSVEQELPADEEVSVPVHVMSAYEIHDAVAPVRETFPEDTLERDLPKPRRFTRSLQVGSVVVATVAVVFALLGSGYLDGYIVSFTPANLFSGISVYEK